MILAIVLLAQAAAVQSQDWRVREAAFREVEAHGDLKNPQVAKFLFDLLRRENDYIDGLSARKMAPAEGWGDPYYSITAA